MDITIRAMTEADASAVSEIVADAYEYLAQTEGFSAEQAERLLSERSTVSYVRGWPARWRCFAAESAAGVVGAAAVEECDVAELWVHGRHRGKGIGTALFGHAERVIAAARFAELTVRCAAAGVRAFYERMGCEAVAVKPCPHDPLAGWPITHYRKLVACVLARTASPSERGGLAGG